MLQQQEVKLDLHMSFDPVDMADELRAYALSLGAELYGVAAAVDYADQFPDKPQPTRFLESARSVIVIGLPFEPGTVSTVLRPELSGLRQRAADQVATTGVQPVGAERFFLGEENALLAREVGWMGYRIAKFLRHKGWNAFYLPPGKQDNRFRTAPFYHMPAMYLAGLGTLGLNCSIITPQFGPRVYVTSIITDCPLPNILVTSTTGLEVEGNVCEPSETRKLESWKLREFRLKAETLEPVMTVGCERCKIGNNKIQ